VWIPGDGRTNPIDTTLALARGARNGGAAIVEHVAVTGIRRERGAATGVRTDHGDIACEVVVNCAGMWGREVGRMAGVNVPLHAAEHFYIVTEPLAGVTRDLPVLRDTDGYIYVREEVGGLLMGGFEPAAKPWGTDGIPRDFEFSLLPEDWEHFRVLMEQACLRIPALETAPVRRHVNGPESFTPDNRYMLGEAPELRNFFVAAGFNSIGIASAAGAGRALAEWIVGGEPSLDLWDVDIRRFMPFQGNAAYLRARTREVVGLLYAMHWPFRQPETARGVRRSVLHDRLAARGAGFGVVAGWERANWFAPPGAEPRYAYTYGRQNWFADAAAEHRAVREAVGLFDQSSLAKLLLQGPDAVAALQRLCANDVDVAPGRIVYTQMLNARGGIECDLTVTRLADDAFLVVTVAAVATHDADWIRRGIAAGRVTLTDVTSAFAVLGVMGPHSRDLLGRLTGAELSNAAFPFGTVREIELGYATVRATRITYVGELGWELYVPTELAMGVYDDVVAAGDGLGLRHAGYHAMDSLRLEKGYRSWGHDIGPDDTPLEAGLGFAVAFEKEGFVGREALLRQRAGPRARRLVMFTLDDPEPLLLGDEPIWRDGALVGRITSGAYGHTLGRSVGMGYVAHPDGIDAAFLGADRWELEIATERFPATPRLEPPYDPASARVRG
jgi:4-methylaminobutanoate oxidase (formaldehyde-forming)